MHRAARFLTPITILLIAALFLSATTTAQATRLIVTIDGVHSNRGKVAVALFSHAADFPDGKAADAWVKEPASRRPITVVFHHVQPGTYAVGAYHDENDDGKLDTNLLGWPTEGYALSNGVRLSYYRPRFSESAFTVGGAAETVHLHMGY